MSQFTTGPVPLGVVICTVGVYWFTRKRLTAAAGLTAALLITQSPPLRLCALDARLYALIVGFLAVAAVLWQKIGESRVWTAAYRALLLPMRWAPATRLRH